MGMIQEHKTLTDACGKLRKQLESYLDSDNAGADERDPHVREWVQVRAADDALDGAGELAGTVARIVLRQPSWPINVDPLLELETMLERRDPDAWPPELPSNELARKCIAGLKVVQERTRACSVNVKKLPEIAEPDAKNAGDDGTELLSKEAKAVAALLNHPEWSDKQIAEAAGCNTKSLYRMKQFTDAKRVLSERDMLPRGNKSRDGEVEAWDESR